jgi:hypothetical protein
MTVDCVEGSVVSSWLGYCQACDFGRRVAASADIRPEPTFLQGRRRATKKDGACSGVRSTVGWVVRSRVRRRRRVIRLA